MVSLAAAITPAESRGVCVAGVTSAVCTLAPRFECGLYARALGLLLLGGGATPLGAQREAVGGASSIRDGRARVDITRAYGGGRPSRARTSPCHSSDGCSGCSGSSGCRRTVATPAGARGRGRSGGAAGRRVSVTDGHGAKVAKVVRALLIKGYPFIFIFHTVVVLHSFSVKSYIHAIGGSVP
jgi:hypothetical protein